MEMSTREVLISAAAGLAIYIIHRLFTHNRRLQTELTRMTALRLEERKGRTNAEKLLRETKHIPADTAISHSDVNAIVKHVTFRIIGTFHSPFKDRRGTPRQGVLVPSAIGYIEFNGWIQPQSTLDGLPEHFSHIWVIWQFHQNTNSIQQHLASSTDNHSSTKLGCKAKIKPPRLNGQKIGCFACRSPHRPNAIGLTKCRIIKMDYALRRLYLSDIDMIDGTPIIDIKPYIPYSDVQSDALIPEWCTVDTLLFDKVIWEKSKEKEMMNLLRETSHFEMYFEDITAFKKMCEEILIRDIRSLFQRKKTANVNNHDTVFECKICDIVLRYKLTADCKSVVVVEAHAAEE